MRATSTGAILWWAALAIFALHQIAQKGFQLSVPWADAYLDPLLCMPLLLGFWQWERSRLWNLPRLQTWEIISATMVMAVLFEWGFPRWSDGFTSDMADVLVYILGSGLFCLVRSN